MIDSSTADNSLHEENVGPHERDYVPACEQPEIAALVLVIKIAASVVPALACAHVRLRHDYLHSAHGDALKWA